MILPDGWKVRIIGVLKNFHYSGLKELINPVFFEYNVNKFRYANLKLQSTDLASLMPAMEAVWKKIGGEGKFTSQLFSDEIKDAYSYYVTIMKLWGFPGCTGHYRGMPGIIGFGVLHNKKTL